MTDPAQMTDASRRAALLVAEKRADAMLDAIERAGFIAAGRTEREVEQDIYALAARDFGVETHWHKRIVRSGPNGLSIFRDNPPIREIEADEAGISTTTPTSPAPSSMPRRSASSSLHGSTSVAVEADQGEVTSARIEGGAGLAAGEEAP